MRQTHKHVAVEDQLGNIKIERTPPTQEYAVAMMNGLGRYYYERRQAWICDVESHRGHDERYSFMRMSRCSE